MVAEVLLCRVNLQEQVVSASGQSRTVKALPPLSCEDCLFDLSGLSVNHVDGGGMLLPSTQNQPRSPLNHRLAGQTSLSAAGTRPRIPANPLSDKKHRVLKESKVKVLIPEPSSCTHSPSCSYPAEAGRL